MAFLGDYSGLAATAGEVELSWCQSSKPPVTGRFHQITWGATVTRWRVRPPRSRRGSGLA